MIGEPPFKGGPNENITVDIETMIHDYLTRMDWDPETTMPSKARLEALGLVDMAKEIDTKKLDRVKPSIEIRK
jgi:aldehyde:ferredoxin oxidoreductase